VRISPQSAINIAVTEPWRKRLDAAVKQSGKSAREISLAAGRAHGYVYSLLNENKDPTISNLASVCEVIGVSVPYILHGVDITPAQADLLELLRSADPETIQSVRQLLKTKL
jgi:transcriptional regulator with XRE-family HTH domain